MRDYTASEQRLDGVIHVLGLGLSAAAVPLLIATVAASHEPVILVAAGVYAFGLITMLWFSAAYNLMPHPLWKARARPFDHAAIFLMIAGTYTPFLLVALRGATGYALLVLVWLLALTGVTLKLLRPLRRERRFVAFYLALGWIGLPVTGLLVAVLPAPILALLGAGGLLYTAGVAFHLWDRLPYQNAIWHGFVLAAASCHFLAVLWILSPVAGAVGMGQ